MDLLITSLSAILVLAVTQPFDAPASSMKLEASDRKDRLAHGTSLLIL
jgi:hypothetical protein